MMASDGRNTNLRVMMPLSLPLLFCQCAILLVSFEGIVCQYSDFVIENFGTADIYPTVEIVGPYETGHLVFKKSSTRNATDSRQYVLPFSDILRETMRLEGNDYKVVTFSVKGVDWASFNIKFKSKAQAYHFTTYYKDLSSEYVMLWARIYSTWRPVVIAYEYLTNDDIGFKILENDNDSDQEERLHELPYFFKRSEIENVMKKRPPKTLFLRSKMNLEDYLIKFKSADSLDAFLELFPDRIYDEQKTVGYYFIPYNKYM